jgi:hypothetical protein
VRIAEAKARAHAAITARLTTLAQLKSVVANSKTMTADHKAALDSQLDGETSGLTALDAKIQADTTAAELRADMPKIRDDYRVYLLMVPKVHLVKAADAETALVARFGDVHDRLQQAIDKAEANGKDTTKAKADLAAMDEQVAAAASAAGPVPDQLLPLQPPNWATADQPVEAGARAAVANAASSLSAARTDAQAVIADLT